MKTNQKSAIRKWRNEGLTLIEVIASIALLGSILVSMLLAHSRLVRQSVRAERTRQATTLADDLLADWFVNGTVPLSGSGTIPNHPEFRWEVRPIQGIRSLPVEASIVEFQVRENRSDARKPLFSTELLIEVPKDE